MPSLVPYSRRSDDADREELVVGQSQNFQLRHAGIEIRLFCRSRRWIVRGDHGIDRRKVSRIDLDIGCRFKRPAAQEQDGGRVSRFYRRLQRVQIKRPGIGFSRHYNSLVTLN
jgi:hypothetical protein